MRPFDGSDVLHGTSVFLKCWKVNKLIISRNRIKNLEYRQWTSELFVGYYRILIYGMVTADIVPKKMCFVTKKIIAKNCINFSVRKDIKFLKSVQHTLPSYSVFFCRICHSPKFINLFRIGNCGFIGFRHYSILLATPSCSHLEQFNYLANTISNDDKCKKEIKTRT